jgi:hypothetical protein
MANCPGAGELKLGEVKSTPDKAFALDGEAMNSMKTRKGKGLTLGGERKLDVCQMRFA